MRFHCYLIIAVFPFILGFTANTNIIAYGIKISKSNYPLVIEIAEEIKKKHSLPKDGIIIHQNKNEIIIEFIINSRQKKAFMGARNELIQTIRQQFGKDVIYKKWEKPKNNFWFLAMFLIAPISCFCSYLIALAIRYKFEKRKNFFKFVDLVLACVILVFPISLISGMLASIPLMLLIGFFIKLEYGWFHIIGSVTCYVLYVFLVPDLLIDKENDKEKK